MMNGYRPKLVLVGDTLKLFNKASEVLPFKVIKVYLL